MQTTGENFLESSLEEAIRNGSFSPTGTFNASKSSQQADLKEKNKIKDSLLKPSGAKVSIHMDKNFATCF
jgi:hypothetical protein